MPRLWSSGNDTLDWVFSGNAVDHAQRCRHHPIIPAWLCERRASGTAEAPFSGDPHLRLQVVKDDGDALAVQVAQGVPCSRESLLHLQERGLFEVAAVLRREGIGGTATFLRLRSWRPAAAAKARSVTSRPRPTKT